MITSGDALAAVSLSHFGFRPIAVTTYSTGGTEYVKTAWIPMPKIPKKALECVFYLYADKQSALAGTNKGGTGFIVTVPSAVSGREFRYLVTNWHVAVQRGFPVVRINKRDGEPDIFEYDCAEWYFSTKYDIAVRPIVISGNTHQISVIPTFSFLTREKKEKQEIGPGDDVFMVGRFVNHQGLNQSVPAVRFGNISMDPAPIEQSNGVFADSYCIDMHSRSGYSGSPVFAYRTPGYDLEEQLETGEKAALLLSGVNHFSLLGIHWGQFPEMWEVTEEGKLREDSDEPLLTGGKFIKGLSGMTCVLPAWAILEVLDMPQLKAERDKANQALIKSAGEGSAVPEINEDDLEEGTEKGDRALKQMLNTPPKPRR